MDILITPQELNARVEGGNAPMILASHWAPTEGGGYSQFRSEHISSARYCDTAHSLASMPSSTSGRNPLPDKQTLDKWFAKWGLTLDREVVVYSRERGLFAARAWWMLKYAGVKNVRILDGGQRAWEAAGYEVLGGPGNPRLHDGEGAEVGNMPVATIEDVKAHKGILVDCREPNRYAGRKESLDLKAGHIPGAINLPTRAVLNEDYTFKDADTLREVFREAGITAETIDDVIVYSGSGNHSAQVIVAMAIAGLKAPRHFIGGWSQWCADPKNPTDRGD
ncbi:sulfurtransferase [Corynebacterium sp. ES2794-CONJ1]|uniref:sulfurtransferase n=1 Tax=unclassified Corynebacterium TaxID=2624378 RepID=UPI002168FA6D|nr:MULTISPECIES: sulfurtransferase [unclassified Corynebacterium]MCS4490188.1 sulfurtransferase [Corynebacterium sp. ES2775-CONJ]MCS4492001.1 sulfurtransferase [Corynebacterium sp. ES2715-CONJ3]MCS4532105.1 sulfurtransferase [Corynebacterium sp. ES2730-CONJ]MCU9519507.1 sulfurtransferase [Corynebacterium sp. ES2794-CONJ1]